jgi:hypothetical protein
MIETLIQLVIYLVVVGLILWLLTYIVDALPGFEPFRAVARVIIMVIGCLILIYLLYGFVSGSPPKFPRLA